MSRITRLQALAAVLLLTAAASGADYARQFKDAVNAITSDECVAQLRVLASDRYAGRFTGSREGGWASDYIAGRFELHGLVPGGTDGYFFPYALGADHARLGGEQETVPQSCWLGLFIDKAGDAPLGEMAMGVDMIPVTFSGTGRRRGPLVFAGTGVVREGLDSYGKLNVRGAVVLLLDVPPEGPEEEGWTRERKVQEAENRGAQAVVFVPGFSSDDEGLPEGDPDLVWPPPAREEETVALARRRPLTVRLSSQGRDLLLGPLASKVKGLARKLEKGGRAAAKDLEAEVEIAVHDREKQPGQGRNVVGIWPGTDPEVKDEYIVISAHYDHVGRGLLGRVKGKEGEIFNGADDNASGTSGLIEIARSLSESQARLRRSIMLIAFDSEEIGLVGSEKYTDAPTVPLESTLADLNMDMISKGHPTKMYVGGRDSSPVIDQILSRIAARFNLTLVESGMEQYISRSDQANFMRHGIPAIFLFGGTHAEYHSPDDDATSPSLHPKKMETIAKLMLLVAIELSERDGKP